MVAAGDLKIAEKPKADKNQLNGENQLPAASKPGRFRYHDHGMAIIERGSS
jgi:hypothetical protein